MAVTLLLGAALAGASVGAPAGAANAEPDVGTLRAQAEVALGVVDGTCVAAYDLDLEAVDLARVDEEFMNGGSQRFERDMFVGELAAAAASRNGRVVAESTTTAFLLWTDKGTKTLTQLHRLTTPGGHAVWVAVAGMHIITCP